MEPISTAKSTRDAGLAPHLALNHQRIRLPMDVYQDVMAQLHFEAPQEEADKVRVQLENLQGQRDSSGKSLVRLEGEGMGRFDQSQSNRAPIFEG